MSDTNDTEKLAKDGLPITLRTMEDVEAAARMGMSDRGIAARLGVRVSELHKHYAANNFELELKVAAARADYEQAKRKKREYAAEKASEQGNWSLVYKEAHDAVKELGERDRPLQVFAVGAEQQGFPEFNWEPMTPEQIELQRQATEEKDRATHGEKNDSDEQDD